LFALTLLVTNAIAPTVTWQLSVRGHGDASTAHTWPVVLSSSYAHPSPEQALPSSSRSATFSVADARSYAFGSMLSEVVHVREPLRGMLAVQPAVSDTLAAVADART
jgi:hypothetical protein